MKRSLLVSGIVFLLDMASKWICTRWLPAEGIRLENVVHLQLVKNTGMAFSLLRGSALVLILPPLIMLALLFMLKKIHRHPMTVVAAGLILGGFFGNWIERLLCGSVTDMLYFPWLPFFICNLADIAICLGALLLLVSLLRHDLK